MHLKQNNEWIVIVIFIFILFCNTKWIVIMFLLQVLYSCMKHGPFTKFCNLTRLEASFCTVLLQTLPYFLQGCPKLKHLTLVRSCYLTLWFFFGLRTYYLINLVFILFGSTCFIWRTQNQRILSLPLCHNAYYVRLSVWRLMKWPLWRKLGRKERGTSREPKYRNTRRRFGLN